MMQKGAAKIYSIGGCRELLIQLGMSSCQLLKIYLLNLLVIQLFQKVINKYEFMCCIAIYAWHVHYNSVETRSDHLVTFCLIHASLTCRCFTNSPDWIFSLTMWKCYNLVLLQPSFIYLSHAYLSGSPSVSIHGTMSKCISVLSEPVSIEPHLCYCVSHNLALQKSFSCEPHLEYWEYAIPLGKPHRAAYCQVCRHAQSRTHH